MSELEKKLLKALYRCAVRLEPNSGLYYCALCGAVAGDPEDIDGRHKPDCLVRLANGIEWEEE